MRRNRGNPATAWVLAATLAVMLAGCSSPKQAAPSTTPSSGTASKAPVQIGVSPGGVTTSLSADASSTEEQYYQACHWARVWMNEQGGDPHTQVEPYLAMVQKSATGEKGSWHTPWAKLPIERQAALIIAANAAADAGCD